LISNRDYDLLGLGLASAGFSAAGTTREDAVELFYKAQINDWATIQPDVVYIASPSGTGSDALLVGIRTEVVF
jgi:carbohydrate-selective porin OprB